MSQQKIKLFKYCLRSQEKLNLFDVENLLKSINKNECK